MKTISSRVRACAGLLAIAGFASCSSQGPAGEENVATKSDALGLPGGAQACVVGTTSLRIAQRVTTSGGLAANSLSMESGSVANGGANINNVGGAQVRISGATINGTVRIAGPAPTPQNGQLINGAVINGPIITGAGLQAVLPTQNVTPGATSVTVNSNDPPRTLAPGNYAAVSVNGSRLTFTAGTYNLASLTINAGSTVVFDTAGGAVNVNVQGTITINGGTLSAGNPALVTLYSNSTAGNAVTVNAGVTSFPATVTAPRGGVNIGSRVTVSGCVGGSTVNIEPDSRVNSIESLIVPTNGNAVSSQFSYPASTNVRIVVSGLIVWGGCDPVNCPNGASCGFTRLGDAQFHSDNCFTGPDPTFHAPAFDFPIQLFMNGAPLPATPFAPNHVYTFTVPGTGGQFVFNYNDIPGTYPDNSGTFTVTISAL
jgi:hypothetical protein